jgi:hypothetical protein
MKRAHLLIAVVLTALGGVAVLAVSAGGQAPTGPLADFTVTTTQQDRDGHYVDNPPRRKESAGDVFTGTARITGAKSGSFEFTCTAVSSERSLCQGVASFSDGQIHLTARVGEARTVRAAIVGGTGAYSGAKGTLTQTGVSSRKGVEVTEDAYDFVG